MTSEMTVTQQVAIALVNAERAEHNLPPCALSDVNDPHHYETRARIAIDAYRLTAEAEVERLRERLTAYQRFAGETAGACLGLAMSTDHPAPDEVLMGIFEASQKLAVETRTALGTDHD